MGALRARTWFFVALMTLTVASAFALEAGKDGWYHTGDGIRTKSIAFISVKVYAIGHDMKQLPPAKSKQADVDHEKIVNALREAYAMNGYGDGGKIGQATSVFKDELKEGTYVTISYNSAAKSTTFHVLGGGGGPV